jgi:hypothetical protein
MDYPLIDPDPRCANPFVIGPVLCGTVEAGSDYYSEASKSTIADFIAANHGCLTLIEPDADIAVYQGATSISNNFSFAFPSTTAGIPISLLFTIKNTGIETLEIQNTVVSGTYFTRTTAPAPLVNGGESTTFKIRFLCNIEGIHIGAVTISSTDPDENPYTFNIIGKVVRKTVTFQAVADAFVDQRYPNINYGSEPILRVRSIATGYGAHTYLKFTVSGIPGVIKAAKILIKTGYTYFPSSHIYHMQDNNWDENNITWNNASLDFYTHFDTGSLIANKWYDINVSSMVNGNGTYTFGLVAADVPNLWYWSRESANKPVLIVTY